VDHSLSRPVCCILCTICYTDCTAVLIYCWLIIGDDGNDDCDWHWHLVSDTCMSICYHKMLFCIYVCSFFSFRNHILTWKCVSTFLGAPTHPGSRGFFSWIFQALESPGNLSLRSWKVLGRLWIVGEFTGGSKYTMCSTSLALAYLNRMMTNFRNCETYELLLLSLRCI